MVGTCWLDGDLIASSRNLQSYLFIAEGVAEGLAGVSGELARGGEMLEALQEFIGHWKARRRGKAHDLAGAVVLKDGLIVGMVFTGDIEMSGIVYNLMKNRVNVEAFEQVLIADDFGLASLPEEIWRPRLAIPPLLLTSSVTPVE